MSTDAAVPPSAARERQIARARASSLRDALQLTSPEGRERGSVIHALFEQIVWLEDFEHDDNTLLSVSRPIAPRRDEAWHQKQIHAFRGMLARPAIAEALSCGGANPNSVRVEREMPYVRATDSGIQSGSIDRLVVHLDDRGRATGATIFDFKTDAVVAGSVEAQAETHREQLQMYRDVVAELFVLPRERIALTVLLVGAGAAVTL